jgi:hypothetical protein
MRALPSASKCVELAMPCAHVGRASKIAMHATLPARAKSGNCRDRVIADRISACRNFREVLAALQRLSKLDGVDLRSECG